MKPIINKLRLVRLRQGLYQHELAKKSGIHPTYISLFETGRVRPTQQQAAKIAEVLDMKPEEVDQILNGMGA